MRGIDHCGAILQGKHFVRCNLRDARMGDADLSCSVPPWINCAARYTRITGCNLHGAFLAGCCLKGALIDNVPQDIDLLDATYNRRTSWPGGFDPRAHG